MTVRSHLCGIQNAIMLRATNARPESIGSTIQRIKAGSRGFRNRSQFRTAIPFRKDGLSAPPSADSGSRPKRNPAALESLCIVGRRSL